VTSPTVDFGRDGLSAFDPKRNAPPKMVNSIWAASR
jgi:hypothetical protein